MKHLILVLVGMITLTGCLKPEEDSGLSSSSTASVTI